MKLSGLNFVIIILSLAVMTGCNQKPYLKAGEGIAISSGIKTWYHISGEGSKTPLILLHGGPGGTSYYLNPLSALSDERPLVFFDQPGCGRSSAINDTNLLSIDFFVEQLEHLRATLGITQFYLYGQSWGTALGMEYYLKYPQHVKAIIFSSPLLSTPLWLKDAAVLIESMPDSTRSVISQCEASGDYSSPLYNQAIMDYYKLYVAHKQPWSADVDSAFAHFGTFVYNFMWGPSEFNSTGILKNYDCTEKLNRISVPVLYICGEYDEARPETVKHYQQLTPGSEFEIIKGAAHLTMHDNPEADIAAIRDFLKRCGNK